jgi:hypothetical protein
MSTHKVIGYFAYKSKLEIFCDGDACIISGSENKMSEYLSKTKEANISDFTIKKTRFFEIMNGLNYGAAYSFDEEAYNRFYPIAKNEGLTINSVDFSKKKSDNIEFVRFQKE